MRYRVIALFSVVFLPPSPERPPAAQETKNDVKGLFLLTDYPAVTLRPGTTSSVNLRLQNYALPPERLALSVPGRAARLDRDADRRRPAGGGGAAGHQFQRLARASARCPEGCSDRHHQPDGDRARADHQRHAADRGDARHRPAGQALGLLRSFPSCAERRSRPSSTSSRSRTRAARSCSVEPLRAGAAEFRRDLYRAVRQPGAQRAFRSIRASRRTSSSRCGRRTRSRAGKYKVTARVAAEDASVTTELGLDITGQPKIDISGREGLLSAQCRSRQGSLRSRC